MIQHMGIFQITAAFTHLWRSSFSYTECAKYNLITCDDTIIIGNLSDCTKLKWGVALSVSWNTEILKWIELVTMKLTYQNTELLVYLYSALQLSRTHL